VSVKVVTWAWHDERTSQLRGNVMLALLALADIADDDGHCVFAKKGSRSQLVLAKKARMSVATFRRATQELQLLELLEVTRESAQSENAYRILCTAQSERSGVSGVSAQSEQSQRSTVSAQKRDVLNVLDVFSDESSDRGSRLPESWLPSVEMVTYAQVHAPSVDVKATVQDFVDYWVAIPGARGRKASWDRTWMTWVRRAHARNVERGWVSTVTSRPLEAVPEWLSALRIPYEEYVERRDEPGWVDSMRRRAHG
jgi:hypothetical protein